MVKFVEYESKDAPTARKEHRCTECRGEIAVGEVYTRRSGCKEGQYYNFKTCHECEGIYTEAGRETTLGKLREGLLALGDERLLARFTENAARRR